MVHFDDDSCGSVLHQVDRPLEPATRSLYDILKANEQYSMFVELIETANLTSLLENENGSLTVLVPKNDVFTEVKEYFDELSNDSNTKKLENIIKSHIIDGKCIFLVMRIFFDFMIHLRIFKLTDLFCVYFFQTFFAVLVLFHLNGHLYVSLRQSMM